MALSLVDSVINLRHIHLPVPNCDGVLIRTMCASDIRSLCFVQCRRDKTFVADMPDINPHRTCSKDQLANSKLHHNSEMSEINSHTINKSVAIIQMLSHLELDIESLVKFCAPVFTRHRQGGPVIRVSSRSKYIPIYYFTSSMLFSIINTCANYLVFNI